MDDQRRQGTAAAQGRSISLPPSGGIGVQGEDGHRHSGPPEHRGTAPRHEQVRVVLDRLLAGGVD